MKKLMIALGVVAVAAAVQASNFSWKIAASESMYVAGSEEVYYTGTGYLFDSAAVSQQALLTAFADGTDIATLALAGSSADIEDGDQSGSGVISWGNTGDTLAGYFAAVDGNKLFISDIVSKEGTQATTSALTFKPEDASMAAAMTTKTFGDSGWYQTQAIPEPTSGLLLLLGVAGLALRRRRA